ncbi:riboflavin biosynthesis protein RibD, partial [Francisella tularensis subsp. holarctica]|nr:riboflavin biosynthesis protein RibD [Francisella tularensis subsp. holarctica]
LFLDQMNEKNIFVCSKISARVANKLNQLGIEYGLLPQSQHQVCLDTLLEMIGKIGITSLVVEGGNKTLNSFINLKLVY